MKTRRILLTLSSAVASLIAACSTDSVSAPPRVLPDAPAYGLSPAQAAENAARKARHDSLAAVRDSIRQAVKLRRANEKARLDSLKVFWKGVVKNVKVAKKLDRQWVPTLLKCEPLEYSADAELIGPKGGTLKIGPHTLVIPEGALTQEELIVGESQMGQYVGVKFGPHGLHFLASAELTLSYEHCFVPPTIDLRMVYVGDLLNILEIPPSKDKKGRNLVQGWIDHFSSYMIAY